MVDIPERTASTSVSEHVGVVATSTREGYAPVGELLGYDSLFYDRTGYSSVSEVVGVGAASTREGHASIGELLGYDTVFDDRTGYAGVTESVGIPLPEVIRVSKHQAGWGNPLRGEYEELVYSPHSHASVSEHVGIMEAPADSGRRDGSTTVSEGDVVAPPPPVADSQYIGALLTNTRNGVYSPVAATQPGDLLIAAIHTDTSGVINASGWTLKASWTAVRAKGFVYMRIADGSASDSIGEGSAVGTERKAIITVRGPTGIPAASSSGFVYLQGSDGTSASFTGPTVTPASTKLIIAGCYCEKNTIIGSAHNFTTAATGWTTIFESIGAGTTGTREGQSLHYRTGTGAQGGLAYSAADSRYWRGWIVAL